ncbi:MAG: hypothetical protein IKO10_01825 [Lachnospiraceae bacterium]|nr:hypothetical protein [Lachnospiraceae bacterium]
MSDRKAEFWNYLVTEVDPSDSETIRQACLRCGKDVRIADLGDRRILNWFRRYFEGSKDGAFDGGILDFIDGFECSMRPRKTELIRAMIGRCEAENEKGKGKRLFRVLLHKELITAVDTIPCLKELQARGMYDLIPLLQLMYRGELKTYREEGSAGGKQIVNVRRNTK